LAKRFAGLGDGFRVFFSPDPDAAEGFAEAVAERGEAVVDVWGDDGVDGAGDEAVGLHLAEGLGEHLLADVADELAELGEAEGAVFGEDVEEEHGPLVGDAGDDLADEGVEGWVGEWKGLCVDLVLGLVVERSRVLVAGVAFLGSGRRCGALGSRFSG